MSNTKSAPRRAWFEISTSEEPVMSKRNKVEGNLIMDFIGRCEMFLPYVTQLKDSVAQKIFKE